MTLFDTSMTWMDRWFDAEAALLWNPPGAFTEAAPEPRQIHMVRESSWYSGDEKVLEAVAAELPRLRHG